MLGTEGDDPSAEENAEMLVRMAADGDDLQSRRDIDFHHLFSHEADALAFIAAVNEQGYTRCDHDYWVERLAWLTTVQVPMLPVLEDITATELALNEIVRSFNGRSDGWGCMEVSSKPTS